MKMFKLSLTVLFALATVLVHAQNIKEVTDPKIPVTWLGVNFSVATYTGPENKFSSHEFKQTYAEKINSLIKYEHKKFNFKKFLIKETVNHNTEATDAVNSNTDIESTDDSNDTFTNDELQDIVNTLALGNSEGVGVTLIISKLNKASSQEVGYIVYFDMASKNIIYSKQLSGKAKGFGVAAHWANPVLEMLIAMEKNIKNYAKLSN